MQEDKATNISVASQPQPGLKSKEPYRCQACGEIFNHAWALVQHLWIHAGVKPFNCDLCSCGFENLANLHQHKSEKHKVRGVNHGKEKTVTSTYEGRFLCDQCGRGFKKKNFFHRHQCLKEEAKDEVEEITVTLSEEPQISSSTINPSSHWNYTDANNECKDCGMRFPNPTRLKIHKRTHEGKRLHKCKYCGFEFLYLGNLRDHLESHKKFKCEHCGTRFGLMKKLKLHKCPLDKERYTCYFMCAHCGMKFSSRKQLTSHQLQFSHIGKKESLKKKERLGGTEKDYNSNNKSLKALVSVKHEETSDAISTLFTHDERSTKDEVVPVVASQTSELEPPKKDEQITDKKHKCFYCEKRFKNSTHLKEHTYVHIGRPYKCDLCKRTFIRISQLRKHQETCFQRHFVRVECSCGVKFPDESTFHVHLKDFHNIEPNEFKEGVNNLTHSFTAHGKSNKEEAKNKPDQHHYQRSDKLYPCKQCDVSFEYYNQYLVHNFTVHGKMAEEEAPYERNGDHNKTSAKTDEHSCDHCGESFLDPGSLSIHKCNNQSMEKTATCLECGTVVKVGDTTLSNVFSVTDFSHMKCFINNHTLL